jgi:protein SCO1/2
MIHAVPLALALLQAMPPAPKSTDVVPDGAVDIVERLNEKVPDGLTFTDSTGKRVKLEELRKGRPVVLALVYYHCPVLCGLLLQGMAKSLGQLDWKLGKEYDVVTVSIDSHETPEQAAEKRRGFLQAMGEPQSDAWRFLVGNDDQIDALSDALGLRFQYVENQRQFAHAAALFVLTPDGRISRYLYGVEFEPKQLKAALFEASGGKVGTSFERVMLRCYKYDPKSKKYEMFVGRYFRAGGVILVLLVGGMLARLWRRELVSNGKVGA